MTRAIALPAVLLKARLPLPDRPPRLNVPVDAKARLLAALTAAVLFSRALELAKTSVPALIIVVPVKVLEPLSTNMPGPACVKEPEPLMTPANVLLSKQSKTSAPLSTMLPATLPTVPPLPICRLPALIVVPPV